MGRPQATTPGRLVAIAASRVRICAKVGRREGTSRTPGQSMKGSRSASSHHSAPAARPAGSQRPALPGAPAARPAPHRRIITGGGTKVPEQHPARRLLRRVRHRGLQGAAGCVRRDRRRMPRSCRCRAAAATPCTMAITWAGVKSDPPHRHPGCRSPGSGARQGGEGGFIRASPVPGCRRMIAHSPITPTRFG
jgi:hypothetical protein